MCFSSLTLSAPLISSTATDPAISSRRLSKLGTKQKVLCTCLPSRPCPSNLDDIDIFYLCYRICLLPCNGSGRVQDSDLAFSLPPVVCWRAGCFGPRLAPKSLDRGTIASLTHVRFSVCTSSRTKSPGAWRLIFLTQWNSICCRHPTSSGFLSRQRHHGFFIAHQPLRAAVFLHITHQRLCHTFNTDDLLRQHQHRINK